MADQIRLNLGCGNCILDGWTNVDPHAEHLGKKLGVEVDLSVFPWPWKSFTVDKILASHILEHFDKATGFQFLHECWRILKPKGQLYLAVPDMDIFVNVIATGDKSKLPDYKWTSLDTLLGGDETEEAIGQRHKALYCFESLAYMLGMAGFTDVWRRDALEFDTPKYKNISLYMLAIK